MSTPSDGYFDAQGNFIPGSFADQLDLPSSDIDPQAVDKANKALSGAKGQAQYYKLQGHRATTQLKKYQSQLRLAKTAQQRAVIQGRINAQQKVVNGLTKQYTTTNNSIAGLQNKVYEASGQYEKLLQGDQRDAYAALKSLFNGYGLGSLAGDIYNYAKQGYGADVISLLLQNTDAYKARFAGNTDRAKNGLPVLSPAEYLSTEQSYRQILQDAGLPKGFYDNPADFRQWIAGDVSPTEIKGRVDVAVANTSQANSYTKNALKDLYGVDDAYIVAWALDEKKALPLIQKQSQAAQFGAEALKRNLTLDKNDLEDFVTSGLSLSSVSQGFQAVAEALPNIQAIAARYGENINQGELERDLVGGFTPTTGETKRKRLASQERALFGGFSGATSGGLAQHDQNT